jgi:cupin fold WbuC family metalloprotein
LYFNQSLNVDLIDSILCLESGGIIGPKKNFCRDYSIMIFKGMSTVLLFNDNGTLFRKIELAGDSEHSSFFVRIPANTWYAIINKSSISSLLKETTTGPVFIQSYGEEADDMWAAQGKKKESWLKEVAMTSSKYDSYGDISSSVIKTAEGVFQSAQQIVTISMSMLQLICDAAKNSPLSRARLCCHKDTGEKLQEMFIALRSNTDIEESVHIRKDECLFLLHGDGDYKFYNEDGSIRKRVELSKSSEFLVRINRYISHKICVGSDVMLIHEATTGPFRREDTDYRLKRFE